MVREYREKALARRLHRDGARLEQYTKKQQLIPVGDAVAVQNQAGRFPKKWDKTGVVVENMDHDKVLVRMDGSRRLTTRNRRFVKKILSSPDMPDQELPDVAPNTSHRTTSDPVMRADEDDISTAMANEDTSDNTSGLGGMQQDTAQWKADTGGEMSGYGAHGIDNVLHDDEGLNVQLPSPVSSGSDIPSVDRPKRVRRPNVKYGSEEYDLSAVSANKKNLILSGLYVKRGRPMDRGRC